MNQANLYMMVSRLTNHNQPNVGTLQYETAHFQYLGSIKNANYVGVRCDFSAKFAFRKSMLSLFTKKSNIS